MAKGGPPATGWYASSLRGRLERGRGFDGVFEVVKRAVEASLGIHRAGLTLILAELPSFIGAYHPVGSNFIVMNRTLLNVVKDMAKLRIELNSYIFYILSHEYLHSLGFLNEGEVRGLVHKVCRESFGDDHPATMISSKSLLEIYPQLKFLGEGRAGRDFEVVREFDRSSAPYIG